ncbi:MAG: hypothetical protein ABUS51_06410 [Acidobacteriota bacterium]
MNTNLVTALAGAPPVDKAQLKSAGAAKDFEALLVGQMLRSIREEGSGWLGTGDDQSSEAAFGLGEEQLARSLSAAGGLGISRFIQAGLDARKAKSTGE